MQKKYFSAYFSAAVFLVLILDSRTVLSGAKDGISLCLQVVIPSLFPFFILSTLITNSISGSHLRFLSPIGRFCGIPKGSEAFLILGYLGGYPVGAKSVSNAYQEKKISRCDAERMIGFCNNPGPAFIFGMAATLFDSIAVAWILWVINIAASLLTGFLLPYKSTTSCQVIEEKSIRITDALNKSIHIMASVCGWVVVFRIVIAIFKRSFLYMLPIDLQIAIIGILELSNGCCFLTDILSESQRFVFCSAFLTFGGLCVTMQTASVISDLRLSMYMRSKMLQTLIGTMLALILQPIVFHTQIPKITYLIVPVFLLFTLCISLRKKEWKSSSKCSTI